MGAWYSLPQRPYHPEAPADAAADLRAADSKPLLNDILDLSKVETGRLDLLPAPFSIRQCQKSWWEIRSACGRCWC